MTAPLFEVGIPPGFVGPIRLKDGRLFGVAADLHALYSTDEGKSWDLSGSAFDSNRHAPADGRIKPMSMVRLASGAIAVNYWQQLSEPVGMRECETFFRKTEDEGRTWSDPVRVTWPNTPAFPTYLLQTSNGRLILPNEYSYRQDSRHHRHNNMKLCTVFYSDDEGDTWAESDDSVFVGEEDRGARASFVEAPCIAEAADGRLLMFMRTEMQRIAQSYSRDGGVHWEQGVFNELVSSRSEIWLDRIPDTADLLCVWNQVDAEETRTGFYRSRLSSAISKDSGASWQHFRTIVQTDGMAPIERILASEPPTLVLSSGVSPDHGPYPPGGHRTIRHPRVQFIDGRVYLRYDDRIYDGPGSRTKYGDTLRVLPISWFYEGE